MPMLLLLLMPAVLLAMDPAADVVWTTLGTDAGDALPLGNGDVAVNVWTEANGDLVMDVAKQDAWSEDPASPVGLPKVGRVRLRLDPPAWVGGPVTQHLDLGAAQVRVTGSGTEARIWVDAHRNTVRVDLTSDQPRACTIQPELWRRTPGPKPAWAASLSPDVLVTEPTSLAWYHRNGPGSKTPVLGRQFGARITGDDLRSAGETLVGAAALRRQIRLHVLTTTDLDPAGWLARSAAQAEADQAQPDPWPAHQAWWSTFWERSWIKVHGDAQAEAVSQGYARQRYLTACASRGDFPVKFNGSLFTIDHPAMTTGRDKATKQPIVEPVTADFRSWGGRYWWQNTRHAYWPLLASGDHDLLRPLFRMYLAQLPGNAAEVRRLFNHDGAYIAECQPFWGGIPDTIRYSNGSHVSFYYTPTLELLTMLLDAWEYGGDEAVLRDQALPLAEAGLTFYAQHFPRNADGTLRIEPANSIEMYWKVRDNLPDIVGLHQVLDRLLALPPAHLSEARRTAWTALRAILPPIPIGPPVEGQRPTAGSPVLRPYAEGQTAKANNSENPELYAVFPFRRYGVGKPDLALARRTFAARLDQKYHCWGQDPVQAAYLGLADAARDEVIENFTRTDRTGRHRFPAFWDKGHDYAPDQCNGGMGMLALQRMLLQADDGRLILLPAWPAGWDADFRLHAPGRTVLTGSVRGGRLATLTVDPPARRADVVLAADLPHPQDAP